MSDRLVMKNPAHPGDVLRELCLEPLGLSVTQTAEALGVSRKNLSELLNGLHLGDCLRITRNEQN